MSRMSAALHYGTARAWDGRRARLALGVALLLAGMALPQGSSAADLGDLNVPEARLPSWGATRAGVVGGVPDTASWPVHVTLPVGSGRDAIQTAINEAAALYGDGRPGTVVQLAQGKWNAWTSRDGVTMKSNVVLRGKGMWNNAAGTGTLIRIDGTSNSTCVISGIVGGFRFCGNAGQGAFDWVPLITSGGGPAAGTTTFRIDKNSGSYNPSHWVPGNAMWISFRSNSSSDSPFINDDGSVKNWKLNHMAIITGVSGDTVTLDRPLRLDWSRNTASSCGGGACYEAVAFPPVQNAGIESMTIEGAHSGALGSDPPFSVQTDFGSHVVFRGSYNTWLNHVELAWSGQSLISQHTSINTSVVNSKLGPTMASWCMLQDLQQWCSPSPNVRTNAGNYLVSWENSPADNLWANNVFYDQKIGIKVRGTANGNVVASNYHYAPYDVGGGSSHHGMMFFHGHYPHMNLVEGNDTTGTYFADCEWGKQGPNTFYRNRTSQDGTADDERGIFKTEAKGVNGDRCSEGLVFIANHAQGFGSDQGDYYSGGSKGFATFHDDMWMEFNVARDVSPGDNRGLNLVDFSPANVGLDCGNGTGTCVQSPPGTFERNVESRDRPAGWAGYVIPNSLYFTSKADWEAQTGAIWCQEACPWDAQVGIGAFGDDADAGYCKLPAEVVYLGGTCTPGAGSTTRLPPPLLY